MPMSERPKRAAKLAKADLLTEVVGEFPELQGLMGEILRAGAGRRRRRSPPPARIITSRRGRTTCVPADPVAIAVALADKIDTLVGFLGDRREADRLEDPYALRRAALGVIRTILSNNLRLNMAEMFGTATDFYLGQGKTFVRDHVAKASEGRDELSGLKASSTR